MDSNHNSNSSSNSSNSNRMLMLPLFSAADRTLAQPCLAERNNNNNSNPNSNPNKISITASLEERCSPRLLFHPYRHSNCNSRNMDFHS